ncbi:2777_t:CDS:2, partial [Acaulospora colombiana]
MPEALMLKAGQEKCHFLGILAVDDVYRFKRVLCSSAQNLNMDGGSIMSQLPVEIWILIFRYACATPFAPFTDEAHNHLSPSIVDNFELFTVVTHPFETYHESDNLFKTLRLVCRDWASLVDSLSIRYLFIVMEDFSFPHFSASKLMSVERLHILRHWGEEYCFCSSWVKCTDDSCRSLYDPTDPWEDSCWKFNNKQLKQMLRNVKILFLRDRASRYERVLQATSNIRALYWDSHPHDPDLFYSFEFTHLTHLELRNLRCAQFLEGYINGSLSLPSVLYLSLHFVLGFSSDDWVLLTNVNKSTAFPRLKSLETTGDIESEFQEAMNNFLRASGRTVTEFVEHSVPPNSYRVSRTMEHVFPSLSSYFPNLRLYGINLGDLLYDSDHAPDIAITPFSPKGASFTLLLYNFISSFFSRPESAITSLFIIKGQWKVTRIMMYNSWEDLESTLMNYSADILPNVLSWIQTFLQGLAGSVEFCDREEVSL